MTYFATLLVSHPARRLIVVWLVIKELESIWKEAFWLTAGMNSVFTRNDRGKRPKSS
jgi:hypothetical protein